MIMKKISLPVAEGFYVDPHLPVSAQNCINWIPQYPQTQGEALAPAILVPTPGQRRIIFTSDPHLFAGKVRGIFLMNDELYIVIGTTLWHAIPVNPTSTAFVMTSLGTLEAGDRVSAATNGTWLVIVVPGGYGYAYNVETGVFQQITDENYYPSNYVVFKDGYFIFTTKDGKFFFTSEPNNPLVIEPLSVTTAEIAPDYIYGAIVSHNELLILGEETIEFFQTNQSGDAAPFTRIPGGLIEKGVHCTFGAVLFDNTVVFIGGGPQEKTSIWKITGSASVVKISTTAIDNEIQKFTRSEIENAIALSYSDDTGTFAIFTFIANENRIPSVTFVYDAVATAYAGKPVWHQRQSGIEPNYWNVNFIIQVYGRIFCGNFDGNYFGDLEIGALSELSADFYTDFGPNDYPNDDTAFSYGTIFRQKSTQPYSDIGKSIFISSLELTMRPGIGYQKSPYAPDIGLDPSDAVDPKIRMEYSDDGGFTWKQRGARSIGKIGEYNKRIIWQRNGRVPRYRVERYTTTAPCPVVIIKQEAWLEEGIQ